MKMRFLRYSLSKLNQVVRHYAELEKVGESVYTYLKSKDPHREADDQIGIVLQLGNVFFEYGAYSRRFLAGQNVAESGAQFLAVFHQIVERTMQEERHLQLLFVRIYEELGLDAGPLIRYREGYRERMRQKNEERQRLKEEERRQTEEQRQERLCKAREKFLAGEHISCEEFIGLCKQSQVPIPLRTHGTLSRSVTELSHRAGIRYMRIKGRRSPKLNGCFALVRALHAKLAENA